ncbi:MAG: Holliday junction branch migration protein RuvA [Candidatus Peribacteraceae bacterium]|nr:Holliday junction branch migration protein RuvA [Candidatus Peribacteraceae bacterium]
MIGFLRGTVLKTRGKKLLLDVSGVGYEVFVNSKILGIVQAGSEKQLWIHTHQTSDAIALFGFENDEDLSFFELLNSVNGVGPRTALDILETPLEILREAILKNDAARLAETPGIGKKTAARIVLELRPKLSGDDPEVPTEAKIDPEILEAIVGLGYSKKEAAKILAEKPTEIIEAEAVVKWFLQNA